MPMKITVNSLCLLLIAMAMMSACQADEASPTVTYQLGDLLYRNDFDDPRTWESFGYLQTQFGISQGVYTAISPGGGYIAVSNDHLHDNAVLEVTAEQFSTQENSSYGIICRANPQQNSVGYYFLISASGRYGVRIGETDRVKVLVPWTAHPAINRGTATNHLRAVCLDDYLAFYVNDQFLVEARYDWLTSGNMALVVNSPDSVEIAVQFDSVTIHQAQLQTSTP